MILFSDAQKSVKKQASEEGRETSGTEEETDCKLPPLTLHAGNCFHGIYDCLFVTSHLGGGGGKHSGSVVECSTQDRRAVGFKPQRCHCVVALSIGPCLVLVHHWAA